MAKAPKTADAPSSIPATFDPEAQYSVRLTRAIDVGGNILRPKQAVTLRGDLAEKNRDAIAEAAKV